MQATYLIQTTLSLALPDGDTAQYPRALVYDPSGSLDATVDLAHVANGLYQGSWTNSVKGAHVALYIVYSDSGHTTENTTYPRTQEIIDVVAVYADGSVWVNGLTGDDGNPGTAEHPVKTLAQAKTIADANDMRQIAFVGWFYEQLTGALERYQLRTSDRYGTINIDLNGQDVDNTTFNGAFAVWGTLAGYGAAAFRGCLMVNPMANLGLALSDCAFLDYEFVGAGFDLAAGVGLSVVNCGNAAAKGVQYAVPIRFNVGGGRRHAEFAGWYGDAKFTGMDDALSTVNIEVVGGEIEIDSSCVAGTIRIRGNAVVVDNSGASCTVIDLSNPTLNRIGNAWSKDNVVWENQVYGHEHQGRKFMTAADGWAYDSKANANAHDKSTGLLYTLRLVATYTDGECTNMTVTRDP